jgi:hypothetical protein
MLNRHMTVSQAAFDVRGCTPGTTIELHRSTGHWRIWVKSDGSVVSQCRDPKGVLHPENVELPAPPRSGRNNVGD